MQVQYKSIQFKAEDLDKNSRKFAGYASTWDKDQGGDIITKGAFKKTLSERSNQVKVLWQHDASLPIGKPLSMSEDSKGLLVEAQLSDTQLGNDAIQLMKDGVIDRMSIGFSIPDGKSELKNGIRTINEVKLFEFSLVTFPMNEAAVVTGLKNMSELAQLKESIDKLTTLLTKGKPQMHLSDVNEPSELEQILKQLKL